MPKNFIKCLLIDDDADDHFFFKEALSSLNNNVELTIAVNGIDALDKLQKQSPDCIFLDLNMPLMPGKEFLKAIRAKPKFPKIPIYVLTTAMYEKEMIDSLSLGATSFFIKPTKIKQLSNILRYTILGEG